MYVWLFIVMSSLFCVWVHVSTAEGYLLNKPWLLIRPFITPYLRRPVRDCVICMWWLWSVVLYFIMWITWVQVFSIFFLIFLIPCVIGLNAIVSDCLLGYYGDGDIEEEKDL